MSAIQMYKVLFAGMLCLSAFTPNSVLADSQPLKVAMLIPGSIEDGGFMQAGFNGLMAIKKSLRAQTSYMSDVDSDIHTLAAALRRLADSAPDLIIAHGSQTAFAARRVAAEYPQLRFVVTQGDVVAENLSSYQVLQEESAWLAGAAAGLLTQADVVGAVQSIKAAPQLEGRGAFYNGLIHTNPDVRFLTAFTGKKNEGALPHEPVGASMDEGADINYSMLNAEGAAAANAIREPGIRQFGNVNDWVDIDPEIFKGSVGVDISVAVVAAAHDVAGNNWKGDQIVKIGLEQEYTVGLTLGTDVPDVVRAKLEKLRDAIVIGEIEVNSSYKGKELDAAQVE